MKKNLTVSKSHLISEWHPTKNKEISPENYTIGSRKVVWWKCKNGHEWQIAIRRRGLQNAKCNECKSLAFLEPNYKYDWDNFKNQNILATKITYRSEKKVWWRCQVCNETYHMSPNAKYGQKQGCPYCAGKRVNKENSLSINYPTLKKEWNTELNKNLSIQDFTYGSTKKVWWKCLKCSNDFKSSINNRTSKKSGCPFCANMVFTPDFNLLKLYPEIAKEWHPNLNKNELPENVHPGSHEKKMVVM